MSDEIRDRILGNISDEFDKSVGSFFYDAVAPVAMELERLSSGQNVILENAFATTSSGRYLDLKSNEIGITRKSAEASCGEVTLFGTAGVIVSKGTMVSSDAAYFALNEDVTINSEGKSIVKVTCSEKGRIGNVPIGAINKFPITIPGITEVINEKAFENGYDEEDDESLRARYFAKINAPATSGNAAHYKQWAEAVPGVGTAKVFPLWNGAGTVKVAICNANKRAADETLINNVREFICEEKPIGATVTVISGTEKSISVSAKITTKASENIEHIKESLEQALINYFEDAAFKDFYISYAKIGNILYGIVGVLDYTNLLVNSATSNIELADIDIPILGEVVLTC